MIRSTILPAFLAAALSLSASAQQPDRPRLAVAAFTLGVTGGSLTTAELVGDLKQGGWCDPAEAPSTQWNRRPDSLAAGPWLSVVLAGFGEHAHAFIFNFESGATPPRLIAHIPYPISTVHGQKTWIPPRGRIVSALREWSRQPNANPAPASTLVLTLSERAETDPGQAGGLTLDSIAPVKRASNVTRREALPPLEAMLCAALLENGIAPAWSGPGPALKAEVRLGFQTSSFRLTAQTLAAKDDVPEDAYYSYLVRLLDRLTAPAGTTPADFIQLEKGAPLRLLITTTNRLCLSSSRGLVAFNPHTGQQVYPPAEDKSEPRPQVFAVKSEASGAARLFHLIRGLPEVQPATGAEIPAAPGIPGTPSALALAGDRILLASANLLAACRNGETLWKQTEPSDITTGPAIQGDRVFLGTLEDGFLCRSLADGRELWRCPPKDETWTGEAAAIPGAIIAYDRNRDALTAFQPADGKVRWTAALGDRPIKAPVMIGSRLLVAAKNNRLLLLNAADGRVETEIKWPTWLTDVLVIPGPKPVIAVTDQHGGFAFLDPVTLKPLKTVRLAARPTGPLLYAAAFPAAWGAEPEDDEMGVLPASELKPAVLVGDADGFCSIIPLP